MIHMTIDIHVTFGFSDEFFVNVGYFLHHKWIIELHENSKNCNKINGLETRTIINQDIGSHDFARLQPLSNRKFFRNKTNRIRNETIKVKCIWRFI